MRSALCLVFPIDAFPTAGYGQEANGSFHGNLADLVAHFVLGLDSASTGYALWISMRDGVGH